MKMTINDQAEFEPVPPGMYLAKLMSIQPQPDGLYGPQFKWVWELLDVISTEDDDEAEERVGDEIHAWTSQTASVKGNFAKWAAAHLGQSQPTAGLDIDTDATKGPTAILGKQVRLVMMLNDNGKQKVDAVLPAGKKAKAHTTTVEATHTVNMDIEGFEEGGDDY